MNTPTPRMAELWKMYGDGKIELITVAAEGEEIESDLIATQTELTAALARIAELEKANHEVSEQRDGLEKACREMQESWSQLERKYLGQLSESQAQLAKTQSQLSDAEEGLRYGDSQLRKIKELEAQLAAAREDGAQLLSAIAEMQKDARTDYVLPSLAQLDFGVVLHKARVLQISIDSARGVTSQPAVAETGEKDAWQDISTAPKDGTAFLMCYPLQGGLRIVGWFDKVHSRFVTTGGCGALTGWLWQPLPPPPQGKETRE